MFRPETGESRLDKKFVEFLVMDMEKGEDRLNFKREAVSKNEMSDEDF